MTEVSKEGIKTMPRGVVPGDRWALLEKTSPSGKAMFRCMSCGLEDVAPRKVCWYSPYPKFQAQEDKKPNLDCLTWMPTKLFRYYLPNESPLEGWAYIVLSNDGYFSAVSDYGNYAFYWTHHGEKDFRIFLVRAHRSWDYFASKLGDKRYDGNATYDRIKSFILEQRRSLNWDAEKAREEFDLIENEVDKCYGPGDFTRWHDQTKIDEPWEFYTERYPANLLAFTQKTLKRLSDILEQDLRREGLLPVATSSPSQSSSSGA